MLAGLARWFDPSTRADRYVARGQRAEAAGRLAEACRLYRTAIALKPDSIAAHMSLGIALEALGDIPAAITAYEAALAADPGNAYARYNLGKALFVRGELERGEASLRAALASKPDFPEAQVVLSSLLEARGEVSGAIAALEAAIGLRPGYAGALRNLGILHVRRQQWSEAAAALTRATAADPADADSQYWLGNAMVHLQKLNEGAEVYRRALQLRPDHAEAHCQLGHILADQGRREEAFAHLQRALALEPRLAEAQVGLGNLLAAELRFREATQCYRAAIELDARNAQARVNLGNALTYLGDSEAALESYDAALAIDPEQAAARWARAMGCVPAIRGPDTDLGHLREEFAKRLEHLDRWFDARRSAVGHLVVGVQQPFWLAYQAEDNLQLLSAYGRLCVRLMAAWETGAGLRPRGKRRPGPIRVGIVSQYFRRHSVWNALVKGWFQEIDRRRFTLHGFCLGAARDDQTQYAESRAASFFQGPKGMRQWVETILEVQPDALIYPEIGMDPMTIRLASLRLAPLQATSWGHPETSGLPTIDCYLSAQALEPESAQAHYAERLVALPHLGCYVEPEAVGDATADPARWALPVDAPLLVCPGAPFKYAPEHDRLYPEIARQLGECRFVFFICGLPELSEKLRLRLAGAFARDGLEFEKYVSFLPWLPTPEFHSLLRRAHAMLDTIGFSGFNTALQAVQCGLPVVTCEGRFMRGRLASGILKRMGMDDLVAADEPAYVALAVRLARDEAYRARIRERIESGRHLLYRDVTPIRALEDFLDSAVAG